MKERSLDCYGVFNEVEGHERFHLIVGPLKVLEKFSVGGVGCAIIVSLQSRLGVRN